MDVTTDLESLFKQGEQWPPICGQERMQKYHVAKCIRANRYNELWGDALRYLREDNLNELKVYLGLPWLAIKKTSDIMLGHPPNPLMPLVNGKVSPLQDSLNVIMEQCNFRQIIKEVLFDQDPLGDGIFNVFRDSNEMVRIQAVSPSQWIQVVTPGAIRDIQYHVLFNKISKGKNNYLVVDIHNKIQIEHRVYQLLSSPGLSRWKKQVLGQRMNVADFGIVQDFDPNPINDMLVVPCHNIRTSDDMYGRGSIEGDVIGILRAMIERYSMIDRILNKHADLSLVAPAGYTIMNQATKKQEFRGGGRVFEYTGDQGEQAPDIHYLTPDFKGVIQAEEEIKRYKQDIHDLLEFPPEAMAGGGIADKSGTAWRLSMTPLLDKALRLKEELDWAATRALSIALKFENIDATGLVIDWKSGLPKLPLEDAQRYSLMAPIMGNAWVMAQEGYSPEEIQAMKNDIRDSQGF